MSKKSTLVRFYLSEFFDKNRNLSFNLKKMGQKKHVNFKTFAEALNEFINQSMKLEQKTKVWFHRDAAFRGTAGVEMVKTILEQLKSNSIKDEDAIEYINKEELIEKSESKKAKKSKKDTTQTTEVKESKAKNKTMLTQEEFDKLIENSIIYVDVKKARKPILISKTRVKTDSILNVVVESIAVTGDVHAFVFYHFEKDGFTSKTTKATFNYLHAKEGIDKIYPACDAVTDEEFLQLVASAKLYVDLKNKPTAIEVGANNIKLDEALRLEVIDVNITQNKAFVNYKLWKGRHSTEVLKAKFNFDKLEEKSDKLYACSKCTLNDSKSFDEITEKDVNVQKNEIKQKHHNTLSDYALVWSLLLFITGLAISLIILIIGGFIR